MARSVENSSNIQVNYLVSNGVEKSLAEDVVGQFWRQHPFASLLANEYMLQLVSRYLLADNIKQFKLVDFYVHYANSIIDLNDKNDLEKLAFTLELVQVNEIGIIDAEQIITGQQIDNLVSQGYLVIESTKLKFRHGSIHSFFSALYISNNIHIESFFDSLIEKDNIKITISTNWHEVIGFAIQLNKGDQLALWLYNNLKRHSSLVEESLLDALGQSNLGLLLNSKQRQSFFNYIFKLYEKRRMWLPDGAERLLANIATLNDLDLFKKIFEKSYDESQLELISKSNAIAVLDEILKSKPSLISNEAIYWHEILIQSANDLNTNGVLQRRSLKALAHYKRPMDIRKLNIVSQHPDKLVHEAFLIFCYSVAPNLKKTIQYLADGMLKGSEIYSRYGLYSIKTQSGINNFLSIFSSKNIYIEKFIDGETIFKNNNRSDDDKLLTIISKYIDDELVLTNAKRFILSAYTIEFGYFAERSYFISKLIGIVSNQDNDFVYQVVKQINTVDELHKYSDLISKLVKLENYELIYFDLRQKIDLDAADSFIYFLQSNESEAIHRDAISKGYIQLSKKTNTVDFDQVRDKKLLEEFIFALRPEEGKYIPTIFKKYISNKLLLDSKLNSTQKARLLTLAQEEVLDRFDPFDFKVKVTKRDDDNSSKSFSITSYASYYGDAIRVVEAFIGKEELLAHYRTQLIHFLPFAFDDDSEFILNLVTPLNDIELDEINKYFQNKKRDIRYYRAYSYTEIIEKTISSNGNADSAIPTLKSFIDDGQLSVYERESAINVLGKILKSDNFLDKKYLKRKFIKFNEHHNTKVLAENINQLLIKIYNDKQSIRWRFNEVKRRAAPFIEPEGAHSVGPLEDEMHSKDFARPLITLDKNYVNEFIDFLTLSMKLIDSENRHYSNYAYYLWSISTDYFIHIAQERDVKPLVKLERWYQKNNKVNGANWFESYLENIRKTYSHELSKMTIDEALLQIKEKYGA